MTNRALSLLIGGGVSAPYWWVALQGAAADTPPGLTRTLLSPPVAAVVTAILIGVTYWSLSGIDAAAQHHKKTDS